MQTSSVGRALRFGKGDPEFEPAIDQLLPKKTADG